MPPRRNRTYTAALADVDGDGDLDVLTSNDAPDKKLVFNGDMFPDIALARSRGAPNVLSLSGK